MNTVEIIGRSSSHFTRVARMFAIELEVPHTLLPVADLSSTDTMAYGGNPALKIPVLRSNDLVLFGAENCARWLAENSHSNAQIVWPEDHRSPLTRNARELIAHAMQTQVQLVAGIQLAKLPAENPYFAKAKLGMQNALRWLDDKLPLVRAELPATRKLSLLEVMLFCVLEHTRFRSTLTLDTFPTLLAFIDEYEHREAARQTKFAFDTTKASR